MRGLGEAAPPKGVITGVGFLHLGKTWDDSEEEEKKNNEKMMILTTN